MSLPIVAIVGRPNVGKSTLVNRLAENNEAIVHEMRGVTRDRSYHEADWNGRDFKIIDTGGIEMGGDDVFQGSITAQATRRMSSSSWLTVKPALTPTIRPLPTSFAVARSQCFFR